MALVLADRVQQQGAANTTVSFTLVTTVLGFQSFSVVGNTNTTYYAATDELGNWESGIGTYSTTGPTLTRTTILESSNAGAAETFSGTVTVFLTYPADKSVYQDATGNVGIGVVAPTKILDVGGDALINGIIVGKGAGGIVTNTVVGRTSLTANTTGLYNTAIGVDALQLNTTGSSNTAVGRSTLDVNTTGGNNTAVGASSLTGNTTGSNNTAIGLSTLRVNTTGTTNTALGAFSLDANTIGGSNTANGYASLGVNTTGSSNTAIGTSSLASNTTGVNNTAIGRSSLEANIIGNGNVALGYGAGSKELGNNSFYVQNSPLANTATEKANALLYGTFNANPALQTLSINAVVTVPYGINPRLLADTSDSATPTINTNIYDVVIITAQSVAITSFTTNLTGTPKNGQKLWISITGTTAIAITWGASFESSTVSLPTTTVTTARLDVGFVWNVATSKWRCVGAA